ncbi:hypothetical protein BN1232_06328 [Mycobacterium lentiflavum]|uniref:Uncharacterized protein n=2 Tax=Mycobacterium simiae complex TaxID=2249310 RepID=A0A0E4CRL9_MYCLN|nr:hypothetical protein BN1232_06328 [Mycobacterium lentiflavum]
MERLLNHAIQLTGIAMDSVKTDAIDTSRLTTIINDLTSMRDTILANSHHDSPFLAGLLVQAVDDRLAEVQDIMAGSRRAS